MTVTGDVSPGLLSQLPASPLPALPLRVARATGGLGEHVFRLRYRAYVRDGYIEPNAREVFHDAWDCEEKSCSWLAYRGNTEVGSIRACLHDPAAACAAPAAGVFRREISDECGEQARLIEANKFVIAPEYQDTTDVTLRFGLFRMIAETAISVGAEAIIAAVRPQHVKFYRLLTFERISDVRSYPELTFPVCLLIARQPEALRARVLGRTRYLRIESGRFGRDRGSSSSDA